MMYFIFLSKSELKVLYVYQLNNIYMASYIWMLTKMKESKSTE